MASQLICWREGHYTPDWSSALGGGYTVVFHCALKQILLWLLPWYNLLKLVILLESFSGKRPVVWTLPSFRLLNNFMSACLSLSTVANCPLLLVGQGETTFLCKQHVEEPHGMWT